MPLGDKFNAWIGEVLNARASLSVLGWAVAIAVWIGVSLSASTCCPTEELAAMSGQQQ